MGDGPGANWGVSVSVNSQDEQRVHAGTVPNCICYVLYTGLFRKAHSCVGRYWFFFLFCPRRTRRGAEYFKTFLSAEDAEGRGERQHLFCPRRTRRGAENGNTFFFHGGHGGARRTATPFFVRGGHGGARRTALLLLIHGGHGERQRQHLCPRRTLIVVRAGVRGAWLGGEEGKGVRCTCGGGAS